MPIQCQCNAIQCRFNADSVPTPMPIQSHARARAPCERHFMFVRTKRDACYLRRAATADGRFGRIIAQGFRNRAQ
eukprot:4794130-Lingulodinium_polyedra.AAC.1